MSKVCCCHCLCRGSEIEASESWLEKENATLKNILNEMLRGNFPMQTYKISICGVGYEQLLRLMDFYEKQTGKRAVDIEGKA